jgi:hypothetical protein
VTAAPHNLDWNRLYQLLDRHRLAPHFFVLGLARKGLWPAEFQERLRPYRYQLVLYGDQCQAQVQAVLSSLKSAGIPVIVLKGWALIQTLYGGDPGQRFCEDIDLLVNPEDVDAADRVLRNIGYKEAEATWPGYRRRYMNANRYVLVEHPSIFSALFSIGLHWGLIHTPAYNPRQIDIDTLFMRARPLQITRVDVKELSVEDQVVYSCAHLGLHHQYNGALFRYFELATTILMAGPALDWAQILEQARSWKCLIPLAGVLNQVELLWSGVVPSLFLESVAQVKVTPGEHFVERWITLTGGGSTFMAILSWLTTPGFGKAARRVFEDIFPGPAYMQHRYDPAPWGFWPLLYLLRLNRAVQFMKK